jgi:uncharacterized repeat protein (TIGR03803 family)
MLAKILRMGVALAVFSMVTQTYGQWMEQTLKSFLAFSSSGDSPEGPLIQGNDGALYGLTYDGGNVIAASGTIFKINCDGSNFTVLHTFDALSQGGRNPRGGLLQATDGALYGSTYTGGSGFVGTLFKVNPDGSGFSNLHNFGTNATDGAYPVSGVLVQGKDGALYGTTSHGGLNNQGIVFKMNLDGGNYTILHTFATNDGYGLSPDCGVIQTSDGTLYGTTPKAGTNGYGTVYRLNPDGSGYAIIHTFGASGDGRVPYCALVQGADGALYGTTSAGGAHYQGTVFKLSLDGSDYLTLYSLNELGPDPHTPQAGLTQGADGSLYGTGYGGASSGMGAVFVIDTNGAAFTVLHSFTGNNNDGSSPNAALMQGKDGALYGTTLTGGTNGSGTVFRLTPIAPGITSQPVRQTGFAGGMASFSVTASGTGPLSYFWQRNGSFIAGGTNSIYTINNVQLVDSGSQFSCVVSNAYGWVISSNAELAVMTVGASVITFDDIPTTIAGTALTNGYHALTWSNFYILDAFDYPIASGYTSGMISSSNVAFNAFGASAAISAATPFNLLSASLTAAWNQGLALQTLGYNGSILLYSNVYTLNATSNTLINFNYDGITQILFTSSGGYPWPSYGTNNKTQFALDNVAIGTASPIITQLALRSGGVQITFSGSTGDIYRVLGSTNLLNWQTLASVTNLTGTMQFTDPDTTNYHQRFYRLVMP